MHNSKERFIREIETTIQKEWEDAKVFEYDALEPAEPKFLYPLRQRPLINQVFTITKADFAVGYQRLKGKRAMCPFILQCSGYPVKASTDRLQREMSEYGCPPQFPEDKEEPTNGAGRWTTKRSRSYGRQWTIMKSLGIKEEDISKLADPTHWINHFARVCMSDLKELGLGIDWRRAFITTNINPYYDSFVNWQLCALKELGKIKHAGRYEVWSPKTGGPCNDQDRSYGEGNIPQEFTLVKLEIVHPLPEALTSLTEFKVYLVAPTLRPETLYGQTNCWVHPEGSYVAVRTTNDDAFICTERAANTMSYQRFLREHGKYEVLQHIFGKELIGALVNAPLSVYGQVLVLPMLSIDLRKGTGIDISVPSHSPHSYAALRDVQRRKMFQSTFEIDPNWVLEPVHVITTPRLGDLAAVYACQRFNVTSQNDRNAIRDAMEYVYIEEAHTGRMAIGEHKGKTTTEAKMEIKRELIRSGEALNYGDLTGKVVSRAGDECVVALTDHWIIDYGEIEWKMQTNKHLETMEVFDGQLTNRHIEGAVAWVQQSSCSCANGLGSKIPWDPRFLVHPVVDSSLFMAYSTVAHLLQGGVVDGSVPGPAKVTPDELTSEVWEYICRDGPFPEDTKITEEVLKRLKHEFTYWYPVDLYVINKSMTNHYVTSYLYNHCALFPPEHRPRAVRTTGKLLWESCQMFIHNETENRQSRSADATRLALAEAGDGMEDGNYREKSATNTILRFSTQIHWIEEVLSSLDKLRTGPITSFADKLFESTMNKLIQEADTFYSQTLYREALRVGFFEFQNARDHYRKRVGLSYHRDLILRFIEVQAILLLPICPHFAEHIWRLLKKEGFAVRNARWSHAGAVDAETLAQDAYIERICTACQRKKSSSKKKVTSVTIFVSVEFPEWHRKAVEFLKSVYDKDERTFAVSDDKIVQHFRHQKETVRFMDKIMPLINQLKKETSAKGPHALSLQLSFDEKALLESHLLYIKGNLQIEDISVLVDDVAQPRTSASPGAPACVLQVVK